MTDILIQPVNQLRVRLVANHEWMHAIRDHFSFFVPGYQFVPAFKAGRWDGRIRMLDAKNHTFPKGLLPRLVQWANHNDASVKVDQPKELKPVLEYDQEWEKSWPEICHFNPFPHQVTAIRAGLRMNQVLLLSPTGSGKSLIQYMLIRYIIEHSDFNIILTVPSTNLAEQIVQDFREYTKDDFDVDSHVHILYSGKEKKTTKRVLITTWQSVFKESREFFERYNAFICDEAHQASQDSLTAIVEKLSHAPIRIGLTGTLNGSKLHELEMLARFGPLIRVATTEELIEAGLLARLDIECTRLSYPPDVARLVSSMDYASEIDFLMAHDGRNEFIVNKAVSREGNTLVLFNFKEKHGELLREMLEERCEAAGKKFYYLTGDIDAKLREKVRPILEQNDNCVVLATFGILSIGWNVKNLKHLIFAHPYKALIKTLQSIGRILRVSVGKDGAKLYDIGDDLIHRTAKREKMNHTMKHFIERLTIYQDENFPYTVEVQPVS